jgi:response regulator RpfG family c-di-GMP phosphodiesterase
MPMKAQLCLTVPVASAVQACGMRLAFRMSRAHAHLGRATRGDRMAVRDEYVVLVVEDDPDIRRILQLFLAERDFTIKTADSAEAAMRLLMEAPVDLVLSDVRMPGMSGIELLHYIKERDPDVQLVLMTAY